MKEDAIRCAKRKEREVCGSGLAEAVPDKKRGEKIFPCLPQWDTPKNANRGKLV